MFPFYPNLLSEEYGKMAASEIYKPELTPIYNIVYSLVIIYLMLNKCFIPPEKERIT